MVKRGDTFWAIVRRIGVSVESLLRANPQVNPRALLIGQII